MFIEHCGKFIQREFEVAGKRLVKLGDILVLVQPEDVPVNFIGVSFHNKERVLDELQKFPNPFK
jgi:hypothetical protein